MKNNERSLAVTGNFCDGRVSPDDGSFSPDYDPDGSCFAVERIPSEFGTMGRGHHFAPIVNMIIGFADFVGVCMDVHHVQD